MIKNKKYFVDEWIEVPVSCNKKYYESLGYVAKNNKFKIHPWDLSLGSGLKVQVICSECKKIRKVVYRVFIKSKTFLCNKCSGKLNKNNLIGRRFGRLIVIKEELKRQKDRHIIWLCKCDCGNYTKVASNNLISGKIKSCGCLGKEISSINIRKYHKNKNNFIKDEHTQKEVDEHLNKRNNRRKDIKMNNIVQKLRKNAKCIICNSKEDLLVHHLNDYWKYPKERYDKNNLVVLCRSCHSKYHRKHNATKEDWKKWLKNKN